MRPNLTNLSSTQRILSPRHQTFERRRGRHFNVPTQRVYHRLCDRDDREQLPGRGESSIKGFGVRVWRELGAQVITERLRSLYNFIPYITNVNAHSHHSQHTIMDLVRRLVCVEGLRPRGLGLRLFRCMDNAVGIPNDDQLGV